MLKASEQETSQERPLYMQATFFEPPNVPFPIMLQCTSEYMYIWQSLIHVGVRVGVWPAMCRCTDTANAVYYREAFGHLKYSLGSNTCSTQS